VETKPHLRHRAPAFAAWILVGLLALSVLAIDRVDRVGNVAAGFALLTLLLVIARGAFALHENLQLLDSSRLAGTDELTGLPNRRVFDERLASKLAEQEPLAVAIVDLDRFKELNDTLGHGAGDMVLSEVGPRLAGAVGEDGLIARLGGDEFGVLLPGAGLARASEVARRIAASLQAPFVVQETEVLLDASVGVALYPKDGADAEALVQRADVAMYQAKEGHVGFQAYEPARDRNSRERLEMISELRRALEREELILHYQPKVELATGLVSGVEALVRWQHPEHGLRGPGAFLHHAERTSLMRPLTLYVLERAVAQCVAWRAQGLDLNVSVNLAVPNLMDVRTPSRVAGMLAAYGLKPEALVLEVTESLLLHDPARARDVLDELREIGVGLSLDDFGTGYSSLAHLRHLNVDELKIDRSFVMQMDRGRADRAIVASTVALGRSLGVRVVAEGVETAPTRAMLTAIGCDIAQGYLFSPPVPGERIAPMVTAAQIGGWVADIAAGASGGAPLPSPPAAVTPPPAR
jgi:diguanylate cyclase